MVFFREISGNENFERRSGAKALFWCGQGSWGNILERNARKSPMTWDTEVNSIQGFVKFPRIAVMTCNSVLRRAGDKDRIEMLNVCLGQTKMKNQ